jgi:DHA1 family multidrug resistance protein-like MFS transporter
MAHTRDTHLHARERANLWVISAAQFLTLAGMTAILPLLPLYLRRIGLDDPDAVKTWTGLLASAPFVVAVFATPIWGVAADRLGHKPMVVRAVAGIAIATVGMGLASTPFELLLWRAVQGAVSGVFPAAVALIAALTPEERMGAALGVLQSARSAGGLAGPFIGGVLADLVGIRPLFFATGAIAAVTTVLCYVVITEERDSPGGSAAPAAKDDPGARLIDLLRPPATLGMLALIALFQVVLMTSYPTIALFVEGMGVAHDKVATTTGALFAASGIPVLLTASYWGRLADRLGYVPMIVVSLIATGSAIFSVGLLTTQLELLFALRAIAGISMAGFTPLAFAWMGLRAPAAARGRMAGLGSTAMMLGNVVGPLLGSWLGVRFSLAATFYVPGAAMTLVGLAIGAGFLLERR